MTYYMEISLLPVLVLPPSAGALKFAEGGDIALRGQEPM